MSDINEVRARLERDAEDFIERGLAVPTASDIQALLADHARLNELLGNSEQLAPAIDLEQFRPAVFCMRNYTGVLPRSYWDKGSKAFSDEADRLRALIDGQARCEAGSANVSSSSAHSEDFRIARIIAEKIDEGRLDHPGFYKNGRLSAALRNLLTMIDGQPSKGEGVSDG